MPDPCRFATLSLPATIESIRPAATFLIETARRFRVPAAEDSLFEVALVEILTNAVTHGATGLSPGVMLCEIELTDTVLVVRVFDTGAGFDPSTIKPARPDSGGSEELSERGYGLTIVHAVFSSVQPIWRDGRFGIEVSLMTTGPKPDRPSQ